MRKASSTSHSRAYKWIAGAALVLFVATWAYFFVQVRSERSRVQQQTELGNPPVGDLVFLQQTNPKDDLSVPVSPYYAALIKGQDQEGVDSGYHFPLNAGTLQPGLLPSEDIQVFNPNWMTETIAVVGDDDASLKWLNFHLKRLQSLKTTVVVVSAKSEQSFKAIQKQVENLPIVPDDGNWIQNKLVAAGATSYPLFIGTDGKARQHIFKDGLIAGGAL